jgi:hypothetical protein
MQMSFVREDWTRFRGLTTPPQKAGIPLRDMAALVVKEHPPRHRDCPSEAV